jgi:hypothetical protein
MRVNMQILLQTPNTKSKIQPFDTLRDPIESFLELLHLRKEERTFY